MSEFTCYIACGTYATCPHQNTCSRQSAARGIIELDRRFAALQRAGFTREQLHAELKKLRDEFLERKLGTVDDVARRYETYSSMQPVWGPPK